MQINFVGRRLKTKDDVKLRIFEAEIPVKSMHDRSSEGAIVYIPFHRSGPLNMSIRV